MLGEEERIRQDLSHGLIYYWKHQHKLRERKKKNRESVCRSCWKIVCGEGLREVVSGAIVVIMVLMLMGFTGYITGLALYGLMNYDKVEIADWRNGGGG